MSHWKTIGYRINYFGHIAGVLSPIGFEFRQRDSDATLGALLTELGRCGKTAATIDAARELVGGDASARSVIAIAHIGPADEIRATGTHMQNLGFDIHAPLADARTNCTMSFATRDDAAEFVAAQGLAPFASGTDIVWIDEAGNLATLDSADGDGQTDITFHIHDGREGVLSVGADARGTSR